MCSLRIEVFSPWPPRCLDVWHKPSHNQTKDHTATSYLTSRRSIQRLTDKYSLWSLETPLKHCTPSTRHQHKHTYCGGSQAYKLTSLMSMTSQPLHPWHLLPKPCINGGFKPDLCHNFLLKSKGEWPSPGTHVFIAMWSMIQGLKSI